MTEFWPYLYRLAIQEQPFAAPLRLIAAGLKLHTPPLALPPFKHGVEGGQACQPLEPGTDTHSTAAAHGKLEFTLHANVTPISGIPGAPEQLMPH